ncbi:tudor domain-containing protein 15 isoform X1 [Hydra vulgaris]|uniref:tudor domain-containing protein 15 isoform X1 n=2 Tax=Hydra vulgaris TaxID=6087 RepID=UPI001F5EAAEC|nr:tudor domain-containing protein 15 isoform X1 [Hydra vulgaris]XP_047128079.1 tudor domain-containing protein 15 isoform X1 [Hydra vulgaris]
MSCYIEEPLFDIPFCRVDEAYLPTTNPWIVKQTQSDLTGVIAKADVLCPGKIKKREKYTNKLEKQLISIGVNLTEDSANTIIKSTIMSDEDNFNNWDPMKISYEQKHFNSYKEQKYDDNPVERHCPTKSLDGSEKISPTKCGVDEVRLHVYNIPLSMTEEGLTNLFSSVGNCYNVKRSNSISNKNTTYGFVSYRNVRDAEAAISKFNGFVFGGKYTLGVKLSTGRNNQSMNKEKILWGDSGLDGLSSGESHDQEASKNTTLSGDSSTEFSKNTGLSKNTTELIKNESTRLHIQGLDVSTNKNDLHELFKDIGPIYNIKVVPPKKPGQYSTYGFVTMDSVEMASSAIQILNNSIFKGKKLYVSPANPNVQSFKVNKNEDEVFYDKLYDDSVWGCDNKNNEDQKSTEIVATSMYHQCEAQLNAPNKILPHDSLEIKKMNHIHSDTFHQLMLSELSTSSFPDSTEFEVCFTEIVSPALMYAQILDDNTLAALQEVTLRLQEIDKIQDFTLLKPKIDQICCAKYNADNQWYRASIICYNTDLMATVNFIDFGNQADVEIKNIRCIDKQLLSYPILASVFCLEGIESTSENGVWGNDVVEFMALSLLNQAIKVKCLSISNNKMTCEVELPDGSCLSQKLIAKGFAKRKSFEEISHKETSLKKTTPNDSFKINLFQHYTVKDITFYSPSSSNLDLLITHVESPYFFYGRVADISLNETIANISVELYELYSNSVNNSNHKPVEGDVCAGFYAEYGEWYRILVLAVYSETVVAFLIDYGDVVVIPFDGLRLLPPRYISLPSQAIALRLNNIKPKIFQCEEENYPEADTWNTEAVEVFKDLVLFKKVSVEIVSEVDVSKEKATKISLTYVKTFANVHIKINDSDVASVLLSRNLACPKEKKTVNITQNITQDTSKSQESKCILKRVMYNDLPKIDFPVETFSLLIVNTDSPSKFHGQIPDIDLIKDLDLMSQDMTSYYSDDILEYIPIVGEVCAVFFITYEQYFRARIDYIGKSEIKVTSIDYGNTQTVALGDVKPLPLKYSIIPCQAYSLSLYGIVELHGNSWSEECCRFFMECCINSKVDITIKEKTNDVCYVDMSSNNVSSFSKLLIDKGYAKRSDEVCESESKPLDLLDKTYTKEVIENNISKTEIDEKPLKTYDSPRDLHETLVLQSEESLNKRILDPYTKLPLFTLPEKFDILVCHIESLECFYSQVCDNELLTKNYEMQLEMYDHCQLSEIKSYLPKNGELCFGYLDEAWYRVYVKYVSNSSANVFFIDYGNCCDLSFSMLRPFTNTFLKFPSLAIPMKLYNPKNVKPYASVIEEFRKRTENRRCSAAVKSVLSDGFLEVDIIDDSFVDVMSVLVLTEASEASSSEISEALNDNQTDVCDILSKPDERLPKKFNDANTTLESTVNDVMHNGGESKVLTANNFTVSNLPRREHPLESVSFKMRLSFLPISNKAVIISITHIESPYLIYGLRLDSLDVVKNLSEKISYLVEESNETLHLKAGALCCVQKDGKWFRCVACSVDSYKVVVFCIDYGFTLVVNHNCIRPFFKELKDYAAQVIPIKLMFVKPVNEDQDWSDSAIFKFKSIVNNQNVKVISKQNQGVFSIVKMKLMNDNESVELLMEKMGIAVLNSFVTEAENSSGEYIKKEVIPFSDIYKKVMYETIPQDEFKAIVIYAVSPRIFYVQIFDNEKIAKVDEISVKLHELYDNDERELEFCPGQLCSVKYRDQLWYRGYIISISDDFVIYLIDYGIKANIKRKNIKPLPEELQKYPAQALVMQINNLIPSRSADSFNRDAILAFRSLTEGRLVRVRYITSIGYRHRVDIIDDISNDNIGLKLVQKGLADYKSIAQTPSMRSPEKGLTYRTLRDMRHNVVKQYNSIGQSNQQKQSYQQKNCSHNDEYCADNTLYREHRTCSSTPLARLISSTEDGKLRYPRNKCEEKYSLSNGKDSGSTYNCANGVA